MMVVAPCLRDEKVIAASYGLKKLDRFISSEKTLKFGGQRGIDIFCIEYLKVFSGLPLSTTAGDIQIGFEHYMPPMAKNAL